MNKKIVLLHYFYILLGSICLAFATIGFLEPNGIIMGGGIGIALLIHHTFPFLSLSFLILLISIPFIVLGYIYFGKAYTLKTFLVIILISFFTELFKNIIELEVITNDILLSSIFSGVFVGLGIGLLIKARTSAGSTSVVAEILTTKIILKPSEILLIIDAFIMISSIFVYGDIEKSLYSMFVVFIAGRIIDTIITGRPSKKLVHIVTNVDELGIQLRNNIEEHGIVLSGPSLDKKEDKTIILVSVDLSKIQLLKDLVIKYDSNAFMVISEASEFLGRGNLFGDKFNTQKEQAYEI